MTLRFLSILSDCLRVIAPLGVLLFPNHSPGFTCIERTIPQLYEGSVFVVAGQVTVLEETSVTETQQKYQRLLISVYASWKQESPLTIEVEAHFDEKWLVGHNFRENQGIIAFVHARETVPNVWPDVKLELGLCDYALSPNQTNLYYDLIEALDSLGPRYTLRESQAGIPGSWISENWHHNNYWGTYHSRWYPWIATQFLGWSWLSDDFPDSGILWNQTHGWCWTSAETYPWLFSWDHDSWIWVENREEWTNWFGQYFYYNLTSGEWLTYKTGDYWWELR